MKYLFKNDVIEKFQNGGSVKPAPGTPEYQAALRVSQGEIKEDNSMWNRLHDFERKHPIASTVVDMAPVVGPIVRGIKGDTSPAKAVAETVLDVGLSGLGTVAASAAKSNLSSAAKYANSAAHSAEKAAMWKSKLGNIDIPKTKEQLAKISHLYNQVHPHVRANSTENYQIAKKIMNQPGINAFTNYFKDKMDAVKRNISHYIDQQKLNAARSASKTKLAEKEGVFSTGMFGAASTTANE